MKTMILVWLQNEIILSIIIITLCLVTPLLMKRYKAKSRYYMWGIIVIALMIPWRLPVPKTIIEVNCQNVDTLFNQWMDTRLRETEEDETTIRYEKKGQNEKYQEERSGIKADEALLKVKKQVSPWVYFLLIWGAGMSLMGSLMIYSHLSFIRYSRKWCLKVEDEELEAVIQRVKKRMAIDSVVEVQFCKVLRTPMTVGLLKPVILFPHQVYEQEEFEMLLAHELTHYKRKDIWYKLLINVVHIAHWYNPVIYLMKSKIYFEC